MTRYATILLLAAAATAQFAGDAAAGSKPRECLIVGSPVHAPQVRALRGRAALRQADDVT